MALLRFVAAGSAGNVVYSLVYLALAQSGDAVTVPSLVASAVSTVGVDEAHRLWTFRGTGRPSVLQAHLSGLTSAVAGSALTVLALQVLTWLSPEASTTSELAVSWAVTGLVGAASFVHLRRASSRSVRVPAQPQRV